jgi:hypothetical protein
MAHLVSYQYLLLDDGMQHAVHISSHALRITTYIDITALRNDAPKLGSLE